MENPAIVWAPDASFRSISELQLPDRISHIVIHRGNDDFRFLHESSIIHHHNSFFVAWNNSPAAESEKGTVVRWIRSDDDFASWSSPAPLAAPLDHESTIWESCQLLSTDDTLWAFVGQVHSQPRRPGETGGRMVVFIFDNATQQWREHSCIEGFHPLSRPQQTAEGNWAMGGQFNLVQPRVAVSHGNDLASWDVFEIPSSPEDRINFAETSLVANEGLLTAYVRSSIEAVHVAESHDNGRNWSSLRISNLPMSSSKTCAGRCSTGQCYLAFNMKPEGDGAKSRDVLAVSVTAPGERLFRKLVVIRNGTSPGTRFAGYCKSEQWSYPSVVEHDDKMYFTYSVTKEDCCLSIVPLREFSV